MKKRVKKGNQSDFAAKLKAFFTKEKIIGIVIGLVLGVIIMLIINSTSTKVEESKDPLSEVRESLSEESCNLASSEAVCTSLGKQQTIFSIEAVDLRDSDVYDSAFCRTKLSALHGKSSDFCYLKSLDIKGFSRTVTKIDCVCYS